MGEAEGMAILDDGMSVQGEPHHVVSQDMS
jgi:hypothetical protein